MKKIIHYGLDISYTIDAELKNYLKDLQKFYVIENKIQVKSLFSYKTVPGYSLYKVCENNSSKLLLQTNKKKDLLLMLQGIHHNAI